MARPAVQAPAPVVSIPTKTVTVKPLSANDIRAWVVESLSTEELKGLHDSFKVSVVHKSTITSKETILREDHSIAKLCKFAPAINEAVVSSGHLASDIAKIIIPTPDIKGLVKVFQYMDLCIADGYLDGYGREYKDPMSKYLSIKRASDALGMNLLTDEMVWRLRLEDIESIYRATAPGHWYRGEMNESIVLAWLDKKLSNEIEKAINKIWKKKEFWDVGDELDVVQEAEKARRVKLGIKVREEA